MTSHTPSGGRLPDRIASLLAGGEARTVKEIAEALCAPGGDGPSRVWSSLHALERRGLVVRDGDVWRSALNSRA
jgi:hypothetical protein